MPHRRRSCHTRAPFASSRFFAFIARQCTSAPASASAANRASTSTAHGPTTMSSGRTSSRKRRQPSQSSSSAALAQLGFNQAIHEEVARATRRRVPTRGIRGQTRASSSCSSSIECNSSSVVAAGTRRSHRCGDARGARAGVGARLSCLGSVRALKTRAPPRRRVSPIEACAQEVEVGHGGDPRERAAHPRSNAVRRVWGARGLAGRTDARMIKDARRQPSWSQPPSCKEVGHGGFFS